MRVTKIYSAKPLCFTFFLALISGPMSAEAGDARCVWMHLTPSTRQQAIDAGLIGGPSALSDALPPDQVAWSEKTCGLTSNNSDAFRRADSGYMLQVLAEQWLSKNVHLTQSQLDHAWMEMDREARSRMDQWATSLSHDPEGYELAYRSIAAVLSQSHRLPADAEPELLTYLQGRALREVYEHRF